jgi:putative membrane protein
MTEQKRNRLFLIILVLVIIHLAGIIGLHTPYKDLFLMMTPVNLLVCAGLLFFQHREFNAQFLIFMALTFLSGFLIEVAGVRSGIIFGEYTYGGTLGLKLLEVPLIIGLNWLLLIYSAGVITNQLKTNRILKSLAGAGLLVILDLEMEPVAVKYDFWSWAGNVIPLQNYFAWFIVSFLLLLVFHSFNFIKENPLAKPLYIIQLIFFVLLCTL